MESSPLRPAARTAMMGSNRLAVAVCDIKLAMSRVTTEATISTMTGANVAKGMLATIRAASPVFSRARPRARPPATSQSTSQEISFNSFLVTMPVQTKTATGIMATTSEFMPCRPPNIHSKTVSPKVI